MGKPCLPWWHYRDIFRGPSGTYVYSQRYFAKPHTVSSWYGAGHNAAQDSSLKLSINVQDVFYKLYLSFSAWTIMFRNTYTLRRAVYRIYQNTKTFERQRSTDFLLHELHSRFSSDQSQFHHKTLNTVLRGPRIDFQRRQIMQTAAGKSGIQSYLKFTNTAVRELPVEEDKGSDYRLVSSGEGSLFLVKTDVKLTIHSSVFRVLCIFVG